jgi:hypothetical protein
LKGEGRQREQFERIEREAADVRKQLDRNGYRLGKMEKQLEELVIEMEKSNYLALLKVDLEKRINIETDSAMKGFEHRKLRAKGLTDEDISKIERRAEGFVESLRKQRQKSAESEDNERDG